MKIVAFQDLCSTLAWVWNLVERVAWKCVADIHQYCKYLFFAESALVISMRCLATLPRAFWQLDEITTDVGPRDSV